MENAFSFSVIRNDRAVQAIEFADDDVGMAVFYETGAVEFGGRELSVSRPCHTLQFSIDSVGKRPTLEEP